MDNLGLLKRRSSFKKTPQDNALGLLKSHVADAILEPRYFKSVTWLKNSPYTCSDGYGWQVNVAAMYSVLDTLIIKKRSFA